MKLFTSSSKISLALLTAFAAASTVATATLSNTKPAVAAQFCQCPIYVNNRFQLRTPYVDSAKDYGYVLQNNGFTQVSPQPGAVVVMQPSFPQTHPKHGHIGVVERVNGDGTIAVRGTNQGRGGLFGEFNCGNVNVTNFGTSVNGRRDVSFWVRGNNSNPGQQQPAQQPVQQPQNGFRQANFPAWVMSSNGITLRNSPRLGDRSNQMVRFRQNLNFDGWTYGEVVNDLQVGTPDARWYKIAGTNFWVPSAYVNGNAPNSRPMP